MKTTMSQGETVASWSVIGNKVYRDTALFAKASNWPDAIAIRDALACHDDLLEACKVALSLVKEMEFAFDDVPAGVDALMAQLRTKARLAIDRATTQKEGAK